MFKIFYVPLNALWYFFQSGLIWSQIQRTLKWIFFFKFVFFSLSVTTEPFFMTNETCHFRAIWYQTLTLHIALCLCSICEVCYDSCYFEIKGALKLYIYANGINFFTFSFNPETVDLKHTVFKCLHISSDYICWVTFDFDPFLYEKTLVSTIVHVNQDKFDIAKNDALLYVCL